MEATDQDHIKLLKEKIAKLGYAESVLEDECQAYMNTSGEEYFRRRMFKDGEMDDGRFEINQDMVSYFEAFQMNK